MEDSFRCRVDKVFGSLGSAAPSETVSPSLWSLTDEEIERREWNRSKDIEEEEEEEEDDDVDETGPSACRSQFEADLRDFDVRDEEDEKIDGDKPRGPIRDVESVADEYLDVQSNIGLDCTLDYEEEEDEYDKVAVGMEKTGDRVYMRDVKFADYKVDELSTHGDLLHSFQVAVSDPRANHMAAKIRLKEDTEAAGNFDSLQLSEKSVTTEVVELKKGELDYDSPKSILKKRENLMESRSHKRVRFTFDLKSNNQNQDEQQLPGANDFASEACSKDDGAVPEQASDLLQDRPGVPDYIRNPSKYTRYTFDSSEDMDDQSNRKACMDLFHYLRQKNSDSSSMHDISVNTPKLVVFTPKRKQDDSMVEGNETKSHLGDHLKNRGCSIASTSVNTLETEVSAMDEDEPFTAIDKGCTFPKPGRRYRTRTTSVEDDVS